MGKEAQVSELGREKQKAEILYHRLTSLDENNEETVSELVTLLGITPQDIQSEVVRLKQYTDDPHLELTAARHLVDDKIFDFIGKEGIVILGILRSAGTRAYHPVGMLEKNQKKRLSDMHIQTVLESLKQDMYRLRELDLSPQERIQTISACIENTLKQDLGFKRRFLHDAKVQVTNHLPLERAFISAPAA